MQSIDILNRSRFANIKPMVMAEDGDFKRQRLVFVLELGQCQHHNKFGNSLEAFRHTSQGCLNEKRSNFTDSFDCSFCYCVLIIFTINFCVLSQFVLLTTTSQNEIKCVKVSRLEQPGKVRLYVVVTLNHSLARCSADWTGLLIRVDINIVKYNYVKMKKT